MPATKLFLSYARDDDEAFVVRLRDDLVAAGFDVWFDRRSMPSRNLTFHQETRDAVAACDRVVLVVGPRAASSDYVRQEWQFAFFEAGKVVTPILRLGDYPLAIDELKLLHAEDFRNDAEYAQHLGELVRILREPVPQLGKLIAVPSLPPHFLPRADRLAALRDALRADLDRPVVISGAAARVGLHGMGGIGKSVLAASLARDRKVREAFPDGIVWVGLGALPDVATLMRRADVDLGGDGNFQTEHEGRRKLKETLANKAVLLVLDDVWRRSDADAFDVLGPKCRALITTRDLGLLTALGGVHHVVELLSNDEARHMLATAAGVEVAALPTTANDMVAECGRLPLAVALCGGLVRRGLAWAAVLEQLRQARIDRIADRHAVESQHASIWHATHVSVAALPPTDHERFLELAVFPSDEPIPAAAVATLWSHTGGLDDWTAEELLARLGEVSLAQITTAAADASGAQQRSLTLHDLVFDYVRRSAGDLQPWHEKLLDAYRKKCRDGWSTGPHDGYFFTHLRDHLVAAGRGDELVDLLHELKWLEAKNAAALIFDAPQDYRAAMDFLTASPRPGTPGRGAGGEGSDVRALRLQLLDEALRRDLHFIHQHREDYPQALFQCLWNHAWWYDCPDAAQHYVEGRAPGDNKHIELHPLLERWRKEKETTSPNFHWIKSLRPPPVHLGTAQQAVFRGHERQVTSVAFSPDGARIVSGSGDRTIRIWDARTGAELQILRGHEGFLQSVAFSPDGARVVSESMDKTVQFWDARTGAQLQTLRGHKSSVKSPVFLFDGSRVVGGLGDTIGIWDAWTGAQLQTLHGHQSPVTSVAVSVDGSRIVSGSVDNTIRIWDARTGAELQTLHGHQSPVRSVAISCDGSRIASGSDDRTVRIWDAQTATELHVLCGHENHVTSVALSCDGAQVVSGSYDSTVRLWDARTGAALRTHCEHVGHVMSVVFSPDGSQFASGAYDRSVRIWDTRPGAELQTLRGHDGRVATIVFSPDGARIASGAGDETVRLWDARTGAELQTFRGHEKFVTQVAFSPDGARIVSGGEDQTIRIWDVLTGAELHVLRGHESYLSSVCFFPDGARIVSGSADRSIRIWDARTGAELKILRGHEGDVATIACSSDGTQFASGSNDGTVRVWDARTGATLQILRGHTGYVRRVDFSRNDERIVSSSHDGTKRVWNATTGECLEVFKGMRDVKSIAAGTIVYVFECVQQTAVEESTGDWPTVWFPESLGSLGTHPSGRLCAGATANHLYLLQLEGDANGASPW